MHPILFHLPLPGFLASLFHVNGSVPITSYGIMLGISLIIGWFLSLGLATRDGLPREAMANCYVDSAVLALLGSRLLFILTNPTDLNGAASFFQFRSGGLVAYGGVIGGLLGSYLSLRFGIGVTGLFRVLADAFSRKKGGGWKPLPFLPWADAMAPSAAIALFVTRIGCYLNGCDFGRPLAETAPKWLARAGTFPHWPEAQVAEQGLGSPAWKQHVDAHLIPVASDASLPVHPTQLYESGVGLLLVLALFAFRKNQKFRGEVFLWFVILYGAARFLLELVRDDLERGDVPPAMPAYVLYPLCLGLFGIAFAVGVAPRIGNTLVRRAAQLTAVAPAIATFVAFRPGAFQTAASVELSTSQLVAFVSGLIACGVFAALYRASVQHPEAAMAPLDFSDWDEEEDEDEDEDEDENEEKPARRNVRMKKKPKPVTKDDADDEEDRKSDGTPDAKPVTEPDETETEQTETEQTEASEAAPKEKKLTPSVASTNKKPLKKKKTKKKKVGA